jgi:hypothetical protein
VHRDQAHHEAAAAELRHLKLRRKLSCWDLSCSFLFSQKQSLFKFMQPNGAYWYSID